MNADLAKELSKATSLPSFIKSLHKCFLFFEELINRRNKTNVAKYSDIVVMIFDLRSSIRQETWLNYYSCLFGVSDEELEKLRKFVDVTKALIVHVTTKLDDPKCYLLNTLEFMFDEPIKKAQQKSGHLTDYEISDIISRCPHSECPVCLTTEINRDNSLVKFTKCPHIVCVECAIGTIKLNFRCDNGKM